MRIEDVIVCQGLSGFFFDDQEAIKSSAVEDGYTYQGSVLTKGFSQIRQKGEAISVMLKLTDGQVAYGDCAAVQYSGTGGRDPLFLAQDFLPLLQHEIRDFLLNKELTNFRNLAAEISSLQIGGKPLHKALAYGLTQSILDGVAKANKKTMTEVILNEYNLPLILERIPIFTQSGDDRYNNVDKMILKQVEVMPHGLINNVTHKLGAKGEKLLDYLSWIKQRLEKIAPSSYQPILHFDVYGTIGQAFDNDINAIIAYLAAIEERAYPYQVRIEGPIDMQNRQRQIEALAQLSQKLIAQNLNLQIVADEWCNTKADIMEFADQMPGQMVQIKTPDLGGIQNVVESILYCKEKGVLAYQGGTCNETDRSARVCVHLALAARPDQMLAKPGMGVDEGLLIVNNEMERTLALLSV